VVGKRKMTDNEHPSNDISTRLDISFAKLLQMPTVVREDDVKDLNDTNMNQKIPFKDLSPFKVRLNYD